MKKNKLNIVYHLVICLALAWMITNGWAYVCLALGIAFDWAWAKSIGGAYLAVLWLPITPEKLITIPLAIILQRVLFKKDRVVGRYLVIKFKYLKNKILKGGKKNEKADKK